MNKWQVLEGAKNKPRTQITETENSYSEIKVLLLLRIVKQKNVSLDSKFPK